MSTQYFCADDQRREAVALARDGANNPLLNGIDYLEVSPDQRTLDVHFVNDLGHSPPLSAGNVVIDGGTRIVGIGVQSVTTTGTVLTVRVDRIGDFSTYRLSLVTSPANREPPAGYDLQLSSVAFSFKVDCPSDFDCPTSPPCLEPALPAPHIDYLAKDYASFRRLMLDRMAVVTPQWTERNAADLGMAIVELLAYTGDQLSYYQDAVATEAYLGTARRRPSVRRHARLVDYLVDDGVNARAWICLETSSDLIGSAINPVLPTSTIVMSRRADPTPVVHPRDLVRALADDPTIFETLHPVVLLKQSRNEIHFYTWGDQRCCLPKGAICASLVGSRAALGLDRGDLLIFEEIRGPETGRTVDANPTRRHAVRLSTTPIERTDPITNTTVLDICWYAADALPFSLCLWQVTDPDRATDPDGGRDRPVSVARGNVVLADHGRTVEEVPDPEQVPDHGRYRPVLSRTGLTFQLPYDDQVARGLAAAEALRPDVRQVVPAIRLRGEGEDWFPQRDLLASDRFATEFVVETEDDGVASLRFGDGVLGRQPASGARFTVRYRVGNGVAGNVGAEALGRVVTSETRITNVRNPLPASGGTEPQPTEQVRLYAPAAFRTQLRAITTDDYVAMAEKHPDVNRAAASLRWTGSWYTMFITVDRKRGASVDPAFREELKGFLETFRLAGYDLEIDVPHFVALDIVLSVCVQPGYLRAHVKQALLDAFSSGDLPDGAQGFFHPGHFSFGDPVYLSQVIATAMAIPGVAWVETDDSGGKPNRFRRWGEDSHGELAAGVITFSRLEIARLENDPNAPEHGRIAFIMQGGL